MLILFPSFLCDSFSLLYVVFTVQFGKLTCLFSLYLYAAFHLLIQKKTTQYASLKITNSQSLSENCPEIVGWNKGKNTSIRQSAKQFMQGWGNKTRLRESGNLSSWHKNRNINTRKLLHWLTQGTKIIRHRDNPQWSFACDERGKEETRYFPFATSLKAASVSDEAGLWSQLDLSVDFNSWRDLWQS